MKKLIIILTILLSSCTRQSSEQYVTDIVDYKYVTTRVTLVSENHDIIRPTEGFIYYRTNYGRVITDSIGKYKIGDVIR